MEREDAYVHRYDQNVNMQGLGSDMVATAMMLI